MKIKFMVAATLMAALVTTTSCGNSNKQSQSEKTEQAAPAALSIDNLLVHADSLVNKEVTIEGICTHTCKHGATKIFLMGSDDTKTIRVEAGPLGSFDTKCINAIVTVTGTLKEQREDEAYLQNWEAKNLMEKLLPGVIRKKRHAVKQPAPLKPVLRTFAQR